MYKGIHPETGTPLSLPMTINEQTASIPACSAELQRNR